MTSDVSAPPGPGGARPRPTGVPDTYLELLADLQGGFLDGVRSANPEARVPWCGRWRVRHLVVHLARIHHWAAAQAARTREVPLGRGPFVLDELYARCARELRDTLGGLDPDATTSTLLGPGPVTFWHRRQVHETLVHLWDLRTAAGLPATAPAALWADTVDELVTVMQPRQVRLGRMEQLPVRVRVEAHDTDRAWTFEAAPEVAPRPDVVVTGTAEELALVLWRRRGVDDGGVRVDGSREALDALLGSRLIP